MNISYILIIFGCVIICYSVVAYYFGFPQLSDFISVELFGGKSDEQFYKVMPSDKPDNGLWFVIGLGIALMLIGLCIKYILHR